MTTALVVRVQYALVLIHLSLSSLYMACASCQGGYTRKILHDHTFALLTDHFIKMDDLDSGLGECLCLTVS